MMKIKNKAMATAIIGMLSLGVIGCGKNDKDNIQDSVLESTPELSYFFPENNKPSVEIDKELPSDAEATEEEIVKIHSYDMVTATTDVNIRESAVDGTVWNVLPKGKSLVVVEKLTNGWYAVEYNGGVAYVSGKYVKETIGFEIVGESIGLYYTDKETNLITPDYLNAGEEETTTIPKTTCINVFEVDEEYYLCSVDNKVGYILKSDVVKLSGNYAIVDISSQTLTLYENDEVILVAPVITGKPDSPTDLGLFQIYEIRRNTYLIGPDYKSYVDIMLKYNGGEGLHDADAWRESEEFVETTYWNDGSHGCVNMKDDDAMLAGKVLKLGDYVLVVD